MVFPKSFRCPFARNSERSPNGQIQLQKPFFKKRPVASTIRKIMSPAGWIGLTVPVSIQCLRLMRELMGRNASTPGGREMETALPDWS